MTNTEKAIEFLRQTHAEIFSERDSVKEALDYVIRLGKSLGCAPQVITAAMVLANTVCTQTLKLLEETGELEDKRG